MGLRPSALLRGATTLVFVSGLTTGLVHAEEYVQHSSIDTGTNDINAPFTLFDSSLGTLDRVLLSWDIDTNVRLSFDSCIPGADPEESEFIIVQNKDLFGFGVFSDVSDIAYEVSVVSTTCRAPDLDTSIVPFNGQFEWTSSLQSFVTSNAPEIAQSLNFINDVAIILDAGPDIIDSARILYGQNNKLTLTYFFTPNSTPSTAVPAPLPVFGAAAAFGYSRKLRKRIKRSKLPLSSPID